MRFFSFGFHAKVMLCLSIFVLAAVPDSYAQTPVDSLEIYDPFARPTHIPRILDNYFSILGLKESALVKKYQSELEESEKRKDKKRTVELLLKLGDLYVRGDNLSHALITYFKALKTAEEIKDTLNLGLLNIRIGRTYANSEILLQTEYTHRGCSLLQNVKDPEIQAIAKYALCATETDPVKSDAYGLEALNLQREVMKHKPNDTTALENLSKYLNALSYWEEAIAAAEKAGSTRLIVVYLNNIGYDMHSKGKYAEALAYYTRAVRLCKAERLKALLRNTYHNIGMMYNHRGEYKSAARFLELYIHVLESLYRENFARQYAENIVRYETEAKEMANAQLKTEKERLKEGLFSARLEQAFLILGLFILILLLVIGFESRKKIKDANLLLEKQKNQIDSSRTLLAAVNLELQESEANLKAAQELAQVANWEWDILENRFSFSDMLPTLFGIPKEKLKVNFRKSLLSVIHQDDYQRVSENLSKSSWDTGEYESRYRILRGGETRWMLALYKCVAHPGNENIKIYGTIQDITLLKEKEEARVKIESERLFALDLIEQQEIERKRIAFEIHDGIGQEIVAMKNQAELALTERDPATASIDCLQQFTHNIPDLLQELRRISQNLHPVHLERMGLTETIQGIVRQTEKSSSLQFFMEIDSIDNLLPVEKDLHIFRIAQEALSNICKHSGAGHVFIDIRKKEESIEIFIRDDGKGFSVEKIKHEGSGSGLQSMASRAQMLGASFSIVSSEGNGTTIQLSIPIGTHGK